jgi:hypothetical protein
MPAVQDEEIDLSKYADLGTPNEEEIKELEPSKPEKPQITIPKGGAPEKHESGLNKKQMISRIT